MTNHERRQRLLVYLPADSRFEQTAKAARKGGATVVWRVDGQARLSGDVVSGDWLRIGPGGGVPERGGHSAVLLSAEHGLSHHTLCERIASMKASKTQVFAEVTDVETAMIAEEAGADGLVACGFEAGGFCGEESGLVLLRRLYRETSLPVIVRGGIGPDSAAAVVACGATGYVLEEQLWLCPEIPVADKVARRLETFNPTDTQCLGMTLGFRYRVFAMIATRKPKELAEREVELFDAGASAGDLMAEIRAAEPDERWDFDMRGDLWSLGQGAALASTLRDRFETVEGVVCGIRDHVEGVLEGLADDFPLQPGQGIAELNGTDLPIHQGPMAQVSDTPEFAKAVADSGSLPWLALANMPTYVADDIVSRTAEAVGDAPWGAGIIGLDANRYRDGHIEMLKQKRRQGPLLGLVAAGTAEQAMQFESAHIPTYLHTPTPGVLRAALRGGHRKFLLEGAEAGGHVGTLGGLALWQYGVLEIEEAIDGGVDPEELAVVPAGGISDAASAAAASALFFGLHRRGVHFGIQMGTAYLMTREAVESGALSPTYQEVASQCDGTVIMGESVNTPTRVLHNAAADEVLGREKQRLTDGVDLGERKHLYEKDNLGGLRAAAKGQRIAEVDPEKGAIFERLSRDEQLEEGLFHCGQGVALCDRGYTIDELHTEVTDGAERWATDADWRASFRRTTKDIAGKGRAMSETKANDVDSDQAGQAARRAGKLPADLIDGDQAVAIIGIGSKMPGALNTETFWENIITGKSAIGPVPTDRWDPSLYYDPDPRAPDKTYSKIGGWVTGFEFDRRSYRLPPKVVESIDPTQLLCLEAVKEALEDAGYLEADFDRDRCAVILGNALGGDLRDTTNQRILYPEVDRVLRSALMELGAGGISAAQREELLETVEQRFKSEIVGINEDSMPGELANIVAGRVAQTFDLRGPNFITDAACASSLAAIEAAVRGIRAGQFDMAVTGGADRSMGPPSYVKFSKIGALSPDGSRPFDAEANGFVMGEGAGIVVLKRLSDAIADGDDVYAVIRGVGGSSDGRGKGITAPNPRGQKLALRRAYEDAGYGPRTVSLVEAHGTSTPVGDPAEVASMQEVLSDDSSELSADKIALGSVKSNIGHLKSAAGAAGVIKAALALKHRVLPPTLNVDTPNPKLDIDDSPLSIQTDAEEWRVRDGKPRRAGVSAFGFGGTNFHVAMEEFFPDGGTGRTTTFGGFSTDSGSTGGGGLRCDVPRGEGIVAFAADSVEELKAEFGRFDRSFADIGTKGVERWRVDFEEGASSFPVGKVRLSIAYTDAEELDGKIGRVERALDGRMSWRVLANQGVVFSEDAVDGATAMLFPGQGSQYLGMLSELRERFSVVDDTFGEADQIMEPVLGRKLSEIIDPDLSEIDENEAFRQLTQTEITQPAVLTADVALFRLLGKLGIEPAMVAGHSLGEYGACVAAGVMTFKEALRTVAQRGTEMSQATPLHGDPGLMAGISAPVDVVQPVLDEIDGYVVCANINCPSQTIIAGLTDAVKEAVERFEAMDYQVPILPVSHAFHSKVVAAASEPLRSHLEGVDIQTPEIPILTNVTGGFYPDAPGSEDEIRDLLAEQVASPVRYIDLIETMYDEGVRAFVEVGPKRAQTAFVGSILKGREHLAMYTNHPKKGGVTTLYEALATLWARGVWAAEKPVGVGEDFFPARGEVAERSEVDGGSRSGDEGEGVAQPPLRPLAEDARGHLPEGGEDVSRDDIVDTMMQVLCEKTGYDPSEIELDFELEADLGVDTVKQAEIMAEVREEFELERDEEFRFADYPTLARMADYVEERVGLGTETFPARGEVAERSEVDGGSRSGDEGEGVTQPPLRPLAEDARGHLPEDGEDVSRDDIVDTMMQVLCEKTGYDPSEIELDFELEADLGVDTVKQAEIMAEVREEFELERDEEFRFADYPTLARMADYVEERVGLGTETFPARGEVAERSEVDGGSRSGDEGEGVTQPPLRPLAEDARGHLPEGGEDVPRDRPSQRPLAEDARGHLPAGGEGPPHDIPADTVISGCAVGLPGTDELFEEETVERLLEGENFIGQLTEELRRAMVNKRITRLQKHEDGGGELVEVSSPDEAIKLAGQSGDFDLSDWGVSKRLIDAMDRTSQLAFAAGFEALRDAGLPLIPRYRETTTGKKVTIGWTLPEEVGRQTGVIFASAFAGQDALAEELNASHEEDYQFNHRFLLRVLGIANSRFAEYVGARGPNTKINNACASTTTAIAMAQDWIRAGRCKRVIILSADNASDDTLMEWVGAGFLATGAATTKKDVTEAALPFDRRRHGMIVGMGALSLIVEEGGLPEERGIEPVADVLATHFVNSAFHPTRLDVEHIAGEVDSMLGRAEKDFEIERDKIADRTVFISHETYTPARGGSAAAEIAALRSAFGDHANEVVIANTKGFTGHAMGAGIEDILAMKVLQHEKVPPIANFEQPDPDLGDLRLSDGGDYDVDYALRLAAGFGSQLALALFRFRARGEERVYDAELYARWLSQVSGFEAPELTVEKRVLRLRQGQPDDRPPGGGVRPEVPEANPFEYKPVAVRAKSAATADVRGLQRRLEGRRIAVIGEESNIADLLAHTVEECGGSVHRIDPTGEELLREDVLRGRLRGVDGIINLLGFTTSTETPDEIYLATRRTFHLARAFAEVCDGEPSQGRFFLSVTGQGGKLGIQEAGSPSPASGAVGGFTKALSHEWPDAAVRVVDIPAEGLYPELGTQILTTLFAESKSPEVGLVGGVLFEPVFQKLDDVVEDTDRGTFCPDSDDVIVVTGGAKGISAEVCVDLAQRYGCKLALVGRSKLTHPDPLSVDMDAEKERIRRRLKAEGKRVTPVKVRDEMWSLKSQRQIAKNVVRMERAGSEVEYFSCDVSDARAVRELIAEVRERLGCVTGVIHGAGVEESKFLCDKAVAGFDKVYRGKALGGLNLWREVEALAPRFFVVFSSVAGRFGNEGQTDYSAANETLSKLVAHINHTTEVRALSIDWTAWGEVGMAVAGSMETILEARGVEFLPPEVGAPMVGDAIEDGLTGEAMVAGELGEMGGDLVVEVAEAVDIDAASAEEFALVDDVIERGEGYIVVERTFDPSTDHFIDDHVYEGTAILPGVMGYELMVDTAQVLTGEPVTIVRDASFERAIKLHRGEPVRLTATARVVGSGDDGTHVEVTVRSHRKSKTGRALNREHFRCEAVCGRRSAASAESFSIDTSGALRGPKRDEIYERFFHTGSFRVLEEVPLVSEDFVVGYGRLPGHRLIDKSRSGHFVTDPLVREMALQTAGLWGMVHKGLSYLPLGIGRAIQFRRAAAGDEICIRCRRRDDASEHAIAFDVEIRDGRGELLQWLEKVELIGHQKLRDDDRFPALAPLLQLREQLNESEARENLMKRSLDPVEMLSAPERRAHARLKSRVRRGEWLASRVAARKAVSRYFRDFFGKKVALDDIEVVKSEAGKPSIRVTDADFEVSMLPVPELTLTHCAGIAIATITLPGKNERLGVDLEQIEERGERFARDYFTDEERSLSWPGSGGRAEMYTTLWTVKEAVSKALGLGFELSTHEIVVEAFALTPRGNIEASIDLRGCALEALRDIGGGEFYVEVEIGGGFATAFARLDQSVPTPRRWQKERKATKANGSNGRARANGANGHANGGANGHANGRANGRANGHANGANSKNGRFQPTAVSEETIWQALTVLLGHQRGGDGPKKWTF